MLFYFQAKEKEKLINAQTLVSFSEKRRPFEIIFLREKNYFEKTEIQHSVSYSKCDLLPLNKAYVKLFLQQQFLKKLWKN
jgi:hypothetical protein